MAGRHEGSRGSGSPDKRLYSGSGMSGNPDIEAGLAQLAALGYIDERDLPSGQGEGGTPQDDRASAADKLRASLREIANSTKPSESTGPRNRDQILASLHDETGTHKAPVSPLGATEVPPTVAEINTKVVEVEEKWQTEKELRETLAAVANAKAQLKALQAEIAQAEECNQTIDPDAIQKIVGDIHESLEGVNPYFLDKAATIIGIAAHQDAVVLESMHKQYNELGQ